MQTKIEYLKEHTVYNNPIPLVRSRHAYFPGMVQLPSGELLAMHTIGEAFESADMTTYISRSSDQGETWHLQGPLYDKSVDTTPCSDYLKPVLLQDGTMVALGYRFHRPDPEQGISIAGTGGILPGDDLVSFSNDSGRSWTVPQVIPRSIPELLEIPHNPIQLRSGNLVATAGVFLMEDGTNPSGQFGVLYRSTDAGRTWNDHVHFFETGSKTIAAYESNVCQMQDGRLVTICWAYEPQTGTDHPNQVTVSHDDGYTWSEPIDTGHAGQSATLLALEGDRLMSVHCHRGDEVGLYIRVIDFTNDRWNVIAEKNIWGASIGKQARGGEEFHELMKAIRFGQPSLLQLKNGDILAIHWASLNGQGQILAHRLRVAD